MPNRILDYTQGVRGFRLERIERGKGAIRYHLAGAAKQLPCPRCGSQEASISSTGETRSVRGLPVGRRKTLLVAQVRRIRCSGCGSFSREPIGFCAGPKLGYSKWLAEHVLALRREMSIKAVAEHTGLHWDTVKEIEKRYLERKYARVRIGEVRRLGIDEVYLGRSLGYVTVVRNLESGAVLFVGKGKGGEALEPFEARLRRKAGQIEAVAIDMSNAYAAWIARVLPKADIVYDRFHVIKLMNERMDALRRSTMNKLAEEQKKELKGKRYLFLRNQESLEAEAAEQLRKLRFEYADLGTASLMKEYLRNIYGMADCVATAQAAFTLWCEKAEASAIQCLKQMARTIRKRMEGLLGFWKHGRVTSASQEGFNNKIGWLTRQAYGYRDEAFLHLKIYDLPNLSTRKEL
jgi:transposase